MCHAERAHCNNFAALGGTRLREFDDSATVADMSMSAVYFRELGGSEPVSDFIDGLPVAHQVAVDNLFMLLHAFTKRSAKVPEADTQTACDRWREFKRRMDAVERVQPRAAGRNAP